MNPRALSAALIQQALRCGASLAGIANVEDLKKMPSFLMMPIRPHIDRVGAPENKTGLPEGVVAWPEGAKSVLIIAVHHPEDEPYMDCWLDHKNPPGNIALARINEDVKSWLSTAAPQVTAVPLAYHVEKGGLWLKDAAVVAGLGTVGNNNLLVTPQFGPRVRLRAMCLDMELPSTGPINWDPCQGCSMPCRQSCPQQSFSETMYEPKDYNGLEKLPGRSGCYDLRKCDKQMALDEANEEVGDFMIPKQTDLVHSIVTYCRACELSCPVGKPISQ